MTFILEGYETQHSALVGEQFEFTLPDIFDSGSTTAETVQGRAGSSSAATRFNVSLTGFASGMELYQSATVRSTTGFLSISAGALSSVTLRWTPTAGQGFFVEDGRQKRPRLWAIGIQIDGTGNWEDTQFEIGISISASDRRLVAEELRDEGSIELYGEAREVGLAWYHPDNLSLAQSRKFRAPPRFVLVNVPMVQEDEETLTQMVGIEPGQMWVTPISPKDAGNTMRGVATSVDLQIGAKGRGLSYKRVGLIERFAGDGAVTLSLNGVRLAFQGHTLRVGEA